MQEQNQNDLFNDLSFDLTAKQHIRSMASWSLTIVVTAIIGYAASLFKHFTATQQIVTRSEGFGLDFVTGGSDTFSVVLTVLVGLLINFFLYRFATQAKAGIDGLDQARLNNSFNNLKIYFMIMSIIMIIVFVIVLLLVIYGVTKGVTGS